MTPSAVHAISLAALAKNIDVTRRRIEHRHPHGPAIIASAAGVADEATSPVELYQVVRSVRSPSELHRGGQGIGLHAGRGQHARARA